MTFALSSAEITIGGTKKVHTLRTFVALTAKLPFHYKWAKQLQQWRSYAWRCLHVLLSILLTVNVEEIFSSYPNSD